MIKVIIAGGRDANNYTLLSGKMKILLSKYKAEDVEIVSGGARGADAMGERFAKENGYKLKIFKADWDGLGKSAGYIRNAEMAKYADACVALWDGKSKGTKHMIDLAEKNGLKLRVIMY